MSAPLTTSASLAVQELVPMRTHVCLPGDAVLAVGEEATVAVGGGLRPLSAGSGAAAAVYMLAEVCAPAERVPLPGAAAVSRYTLESPAARRYTLAVGDPIVAIVARKVSNFFYYCYTGGAALASLDALAFDGATKSSRPRLLEGDVLFTYVKSTGAAPAALATAGGEGSAGVPGLVAASGEAELSCTAAEVGLAPKDWTSGESVFGPLTGGRVLSLPLPYARSLLTACDPHLLQAGGATPVPASYLLSLLGEEVPFDVCVGMNGLAWVRGRPSELDAAAEVRRTVAVCACITEAQYDVTKEEVEARVASYFPK